VEPNVGVKARVGLVVLGAQVAAVDPVTYH